MIEILEHGRTFHLKTRHTSRILHVTETGHVMDLYWGSRVEGDAFGYMIKDIKKASYLCGTDGDGAFRLEQYPVLYPGWGNPDLRSPAFSFCYEDGSRITDLRFDGYELRQKKEKLPGLPTLLDSGAEAFRLFLRDSVKQVCLTLEFGIFEKLDAMTQSVRVENKGDQPFTADRLMSACVSLMEDGLQAVTLTGAWGRECTRNSLPLCQGIFQTGSTRGAGGHGQNPFMALTQKGLEERDGQIWAVNLVYSGSFLCEAEVDMHQNTRFMAGIQPEGFSWRLEPGESFYSPEAVLIHSDRGLEEMTHRFHRLYRACLLRSHERRTPPVLLNSWEAAYFDFNKETLLALAKEGASAGAELFVLDDGWFGRRNGADSSLGDWTENRKKLGGSLKELAEEIRGLGMEFGLWFEPEMVSPDSCLYRSHPDWAIQVPGRRPQLARDQLVLDLSRREVQDYIIEAVDRVLSSAPITYVKWDMNRNITDWYSSALGAGCQKELGHRYILGLYRILEKLTEKHRNVLFEGCAGGGGRFDPGILYYMPQIWASDDTDPIERLEIQTGTAMVYPAVSMGCHVSASPNHMTGRLSPLSVRGVTAMEGNLGYELDLTGLAQEEKEEIRRQIHFYKEIRSIIQEGDLYRLRSAGNERAWMYVTENREQAVVSYVRILSRPNTVPGRLRLYGLDPLFTYQVQDQESGTALLRTGSSLMHIGLALPKGTGDFDGTQYTLVRSWNLPCTHLCG
ncbi:MAG: alpha-galactosidase [Enterocloster sp.]